MRRVVFGLLVIVAACSGGETEPTTTSPVAPSTTTSTPAPTTTSSQPTTGTSQPAPDDGTESISITDKVTIVITDPEGG